LDCFQPLLLLWPYASGRCLDLNAGEHRHLLAHHLRGDRDGAIANQVGAAFAEAKGNRSAVLVAERAGVIAKEPGSAGAACYADVLLDLLFRHLLAGARVPMVWQLPEALPRCLRL
jgi:hypothetical protein